MELTTISTRPMNTGVKLTGGKYKGKKFKREQPRVWIQQWDKSTPRPVCWQPLHLSHLEIMAGRPVILH